MASITIAIPVVLINEKRPSICWAFFFLWLVSKNLTRSAFVFRFGKLDLVGLTKLILI